MDTIKLCQFKEKLELRGYSKRSVHDYPVDVRKFFEYLEEHEDIGSINKISPEHLTAWHTHLQYTTYSKGKYRSVSTVHRLLTSVKTFYSIMYREKLVPHDYAHFITLPKKKKHLPRHIPDQKGILALLQAAEPKDPLTIRDRCMLELLYATGIRNEELRTECVDDYNMADGTLFIRGKGAKDRIVPVGKWVIPYLHNYLEHSRPLLVGNKPGALLFVSKNGNMLSTSNLWAIIRKYSKKAGIGKISAHTLRHACATHLLQNGADIRWIQELLGHSDLSSTQIYTKIDITHLKQAHSKYHPRERVIHDR